MAQGSWLYIAIISPLSAIGQGAIEMSTPPAKGLEWHQRQLRRRQPVTVEAAHLAEERADLLVLPGLAVPTNHPPWPRT